MKFVALTKIEEGGRELVVLYNRDFFKYMVPADPESGGLTWLKLATEDRPHLIKEAADTIRHLSEPVTG